MSHRFQNVYDEINRVESELKSLKQNVVSLQQKATTVSISSNPPTRIQTNITLITIVNPIGVSLNELIESAKAFYGERMKREDATSSLSMELFVVVLGSLSNEDTLQRTSTNLDVLYTDSHVKIFEISNWYTLEHPLNKLAKLASGEYMFFLWSNIDGMRNSARFIRLSEMMRFAKENNLLIIGSKIVIKSASESMAQIFSCGINVDVFDRPQESQSNTSSIRLSHSFRGYDWKYKPSKQSNPQIKAVSKNGMLVFRQAFLDVSGFAFFGPEIGSEIYQDIDFALRVRQTNNNRPVIGFFANNIIFLEGWASMQNKITASSPNFPIRQNIEQTFEKKWLLYLQQQASSSVKKDLIPFRLIWDTYCGCTGVNIEVVNFLYPLSNYLERLGVIAGPDCFCKGFPEQIQEKLQQIRSHAVVHPSSQLDFFVSHKPPKNYPSFPYKGMANIHIRPRYVIGRSMSEEQPISKEWVDNCNSGKVDEIWVPSQFHIDVFSQSGVRKEKLFRIPEATDTDYYDPEIVQPLPLSHLKREGDFNFLSVFKWEERKGWRFLLQAYFEEFSNADKVTLFLQTYLYGDSNPYNEEKLRKIIDNFASKNFKNKTANLPRVQLLMRELDESDMPRLYKAFDAFVLPSRGEGWGLPVMEAMAMGLPTIATNWSGITDFLNANNGYPIQVEKLVEKDSTFDENDNIEFGNESPKKLDSVQKWAKASFYKLFLIYNNGFEFAF